MAFYPTNYIKPDRKINKLRKRGKEPSEIQEIQLQDRGISMKKDKYVIAANVFIGYAMKRTAAKENEQGIWFYNFSENHYDHLTDKQIKKIFFTLIEEAGEEFWNSTMERQYIAYFNNKIPDFENSGTQPGMLQFNNVLLDFTGDTVEEIKPSPDYYCNFRIPYDYIADAECPQFIEFLNDIFENDQERIDLIQEIMGACLLYDKCMQYLVIFLGNGSNGKSLLASVIKKMLGEKNVSAIALDKLSGDRFSKQNLDKKLLNISSETNPEKVYSTSDLKTLTGGDAVEVEKKFCDAYTTELYCKFILLANNMIQTADYSDGFYRRLMIIPFNKQYYDLAAGEEPEEGKQYKDIYLEGKLSEELPGIFNFAMEGLLRLYQNDFHFTVSQKCEAALTRYKNEHNVVKAFMNECIRIAGDSKSSIRCSKLFPSFEDFCRKNHYYRQSRQITRTKFLDLFQQIIDDEAYKFNRVKCVKRNGIYVYVGLKFR